MWPNTKLYRRIMSKAIWVPDTHSDSPAYSAHAPELPFSKSQECFRRSERHLLMPEVQRQMDCLTKATGYRHSDRQGSTSRVWQ
jgi:hypothetical protein